MENSSEAGAQLVQALDCLRKEDGEGNDISDVKARREALDILMKNGLTSNEIRYVRDQLNVVAFSKDILRSLPGDLQLCVVEYLSISDILNVACVSKSWAELLYGEKMCPLLMKIHFRSQWYKHSTNQHQLELPKWLRGAIHALINRQKAPLHCEIYDYFMEKDMDWGYKFWGYWYHQYSNGRIAYRPDWRRIVVRSLSSKGESNMVFMSEDRTILKHWALSNEILIASSNRSIVTWSFADQTYRNFTLPGGTRSVAAHHKRFTVITDSYEIFSGEIRGDLRLINAPLTGAKNVKPFGVVYHPDDENRLFVFCSSAKKDDPGYPGSLLIQEFVNGEQGLLDIKFQYPDRFLWKNMHEIKLDLARLRLGFVDIYMDIFRTKYSPKLQFDIYTKTLTVSNYTLFPGEFPSLNPDEMFSVKFSPEHYKVNCYDPHIELSKECIRPWENPWYNNDDLVVDESEVDGLTW